MVDKHILMLVNDPLELVGPDTILGWATENGWVDAKPMRYADITVSAPDDEALCRILHQMGLMP